MKKLGFKSTIPVFLLMMTACSTISPAQTSIEGGSQSTGDEGTAPTLEAAWISEFQPAGVLAYTDNNTSLMYYDSNGQFVSEFNTPGIMSADPTNVHMAGSMSNDESTAPLVYHSWEPAQALTVNDNGTIITLRNSTAFLAMAGAAGQSALVFSEVLIEDNIPHSYLYAGNLDNIGSASAFYDMKDEHFQMALSPVSLKAVAGNPQGVWYTQTAWGIGGPDLIYPITRGLYYFDLTNDENLQYLDVERNFQGISPDMQLAGSIEFDAEGDHSMAITNLNTDQVIQFPLKSSSDRGAGYAVFSPGNQYAAWLEASGSFVTDPVSFQAVVRIGNLTSGNVDYEVKDTIIAQAIGINSVSFIKPVGWLDSQSLLIEMRGDDWGQVSLVRYNLGDNSLSTFCEGSFAGFTH